MSIEELDRIAAGLPEWEGSPAPAAGVDGVQEAIDRWRLRVHAFHAAEILRDQQSHERFLDRTERVVWVLLVSLAAGAAVAWYVNAVMEPPQQAEFLKEKP